MNISVLKIAVLVMFLTACATGPKPAVDYNPEYNFDQLQTFAIVDAVTVDQNGTKIIDRNISDIDNDRVSKSITLALQAKGMTEIAQPYADMLVKYLIVTKDKTKIRTYNSGIYNCWHCRGYHYPFHASATQISVKDYVEGTLIIDFIDPLQNKSVWRSVVSQAVKNDIAVEQRQANVQHLVNLMLATFKAPVVHSN